MSDEIEKSSFEYFIEMVEKVIKNEIDLEPGKNRIQNLGEGLAMWGLARGSAMVYIMITKGETNHYIQVFSPIMKISQKKQVGLYLKLLELNSSPELCNTAFAVKDSNVILKSDRTTATLMGSELHEMIVRIGTLADKYDDELLAEFGGEMFN
jgi:T3SS (YopN, CesT) and YbjN peptide-binding chaperone 1